MAANNAIGWVQFRLIGGARNLAFTAIAYTAAAIVLMIFATQISYRPSFSELGYYVPLVSGVQMVVLLLWGTMRVGHAVPLDVQTGILESHRLMPVSPVSAIVGYLFGSTAQVLSIFGVNVLLGAVCVAAASMPVRLWLLASVVLLFYAVMVWTIVVFFSFRFGATAICVVGLQIIMNILRAEPMQVMPGVQMIAMPIADASFFNLSRFDGLEPSLVIGLVLQALIIGVYAVAAGRRYARDGALAFDWPLSTLLLALGVGASIGGCVLLLERIQVRWNFYGPSHGVMVFTSSVTPLVLLAILPISAAIRFRGMRPFFSVLGSACLVGLMMFTAPKTADHPVKRMIICAMAIAAFLFSVRYVLGIALIRRWRPRLTVGAWIFALWLLPAMLDAVISMNTPYSAREAVFAWSPIVSLPSALYDGWNRFYSIHDGSEWSAPAAQALFAAFAALVFYSSKRRIDRPRAIPQVTPLPAEVSGDVTAN